MKKTISLLTTLIACMFLITSCNSNSKNVNPDIEIRQELREHYNYQPGTYWIYYDSVNNRTDSLFVTKNTYFTDPKNGVDYINHGITIKSSQFPNSEWENMICVIGLVRKDEINFGYFFPLIDSAMSFPGFSIVTPFTPNLASKIINGKEYKNVMSIVGNLKPEQNDSLFISRDVGVIKMKFPTTNTNYNLLRYKIAIN